MLSPTSAQRSRHTEATKITDQWLAVGHYDPDFVSGTQADIESLRRLPPNWDSYGGAVIDPSVIDAAKAFVAKLPESLAFRPRVVPMSNGTLQLEWHDQSRSLELEFDSSQTIRYLQWNPGTGEEEEDSIPVQDIETAVMLIRWFMSRAHG